MYERYRIKKDAIFAIHDELKKVAVDLIKKIKGMIAELNHWTDKPETKAVIDKLIRDTL